MAEIQHRSHRYLGAEQHTLLVDGVARVTITRRSDHEFYAHFNRPRINGVRWAPPAHLEHGLVSSTLGEAIATAESELLPLL